MKTLITNIGQLATPRGSGPIAGKAMSALAVYEGVELLVDGDRVATITPGSNRSAADRLIDADGGVVLPGLVDPHTHAVFAGTQEETYLAYAQGTPYDDTAILASAHAVAEADEEQLLEQSLPHLQRMLASGTTTIEIKSGYGLSMDGEIKLLVAIRQMKKALPMRVIATFLGAHALPEKERRDDYISTIITQMIPTVRRRRLAQFCDVFCDSGFFTLAETRTILRAARGAGLRLKMHADGLSHTGGAELAAELEATSADHLLKASEKGMKLLGQAGVIPVLLPGTAFALGTTYAPARRMIELDLPLALATDFNPDTCLIHSMLTIIGLAVMTMDLSVEEAITAATMNAACALELSEEIGSLEKGKAADLVLLDLDTYRQIPYYFGHNPVRMVMKGGQVVYESP